MLRPLRPLIVALAAGAIYAAPVGAEITEALGAAVTDDRLDAHRGGEALTIGGIDAVFNEMNVNGQTNGNSAVGNYTGDNAVSNDAFSNAHGMTTLIQNTGNNVLIQNATILNFSLE